MVQPAPDASRDVLQVCVFDQRRGLQEGEELDKILFFYPPTTSKEEQQSVIGLTEGLIVFSRVFDMSGPCDSVNTEKHRVVLLECEPSIWMVLVVQKLGASNGKVGSQGKGVETGLRDGALRSILVEAHALFRLFFGRIAPMADSSGDWARAALSAVLSDYLAHFVGSGGRLRLPTSEEGLWERGMMQMMPLDRQTHLAVQSLVGMLQTAYGGGVVRHTMLLYHSLLVWSSLPKESSRILYVYSLLRLIPSAVKAGTNGSAPPKPASNGPAAATRTLSRGAARFRPSSTSGSRGGATSAGPSSNHNGAAQPPPRPHPTIRSLFAPSHPPQPRNTSSSNLARLHSSLSTPSSSLGPTPGTVTPPQVLDTPISSDQPTPQLSPPQNPTSLSPSDSATLLEAADPSVSPLPPSFAAAAAATTSSSSTSTPPFPSIIPRPLRPLAWWREKDGFLATNAWGVETPAGGGSASAAAGSGVPAGPAVPVVRLLGSEEEFQLCVIQLGDVTLLLLLPEGHLEGAVANSLLRSQLMEKVAVGLSVLDEAMASQWSGPNSSHIQGCRYLWLDRANATLRASPRPKVGTLSKDSLAALNHVREEIDSKRSWQADQVAEEGGSAESVPAQHASRELCARTGGGAWAMVRKAGTRELYTVLEKASDTLLLSSEVVEKLSVRHFDGAFASD